MGDRRFGLSTHLFHDHRLTRDHLALVAKHGFGAVELFATRTHFDYRDADAVAQLTTWLHETGLELHSVHAPIAEAVRRGEMVVPYSTASGDEARRAVAVDEAKAALALAARIPFRYLVLHLGVPTRTNPPANDNQPAAARRSLEEILDGPACELWLVIVGGDALGGRRAQVQDEMAIRNVFGERDGSFRFL